MAGYVWQLYFGSSMKPELQEGFLFGTEHAFEVEVAKVDAPSNPCTNHRLLNEENAQRVFDLLQGGSVIRAQVSPMILRPKVYIGAAGVQVDFLTEEEKDRFRTLHRAHVRDHGEGHEALKEFLKCFTWEPVDGQHIRSACIDVATAEVKAGSITTAEYESVYSRWAAQVVIYDEPWLYVELSRQVCTI
jgi:hypothetical protein